METFYVTLPSNVKNQYHDNKIGSYRTQLPTTLCLDSGWKVGLTGIHYTNSWYNLKQYNSILLVKQGDDSIIYSTLAFLSPGRYNKMDDLLADIRNRIVINSPVTKLPYLSYNPFSRKVTIVFGKTKTFEDITFKFGKELSDLLGVGDGFMSQEDMKKKSPSYLGDNNKIPKLIRDKLDESTVRADIWEAKNTYDITGGIHSLMVYCDIVDFSVVGDVRAQMLRVVEIPPHSEFGESVVLTYERPYYLPLATKEIQAIEIDIKDDSGHQIDFRFGRVEVTLQFVKNG